MLPGRDNLAEYDAAGNLTAATLLLYLPCDECGG